MAERSPCIVYTDGDLADVLFVLPPMGREMRKGDEFTYTASDGQATRYKIKTVEYRVEQVSPADADPPQVLWRPPEVRYGVTVV